MPLISQFDQVTPAWLSEVLGESVIECSMTTLKSNWANHAAIRATLASGEIRKIWLKICLEPKIGRSEIDYYTHDYLDLPDAPIIDCYDAGYEPGVGYHLLFPDLSDDYHDRKVVPPTLEHGLAIAEAVARMHRHYWECSSPKDASLWEPFFAELRPCVAIMEGATGMEFSDNFESHAKKLAKRWSDPSGLTLLHGDLNPTNVLTPKDAESPVYFLDRQPLDGVTTYGLAVDDLAYALALWWPKAVWKTHQEEILRCWYETLGKPSYSWDLAQSDWELSVEQCLHVPMMYCESEEMATEMAWLWKWQLGNVLGKEIP